MDLVRRNVQIDFGTIQGVLPWNMIPSDVDGLMEINGSFLMIETKFRQAPLSKGQYKMLLAMSKLKEFTVLVISKEEEEAAPGVYRFLPTHWRTFTNGLMTDWKQCDMDKFKCFIKEWFKYAR